MAIKTGGSKVTEALRSQEREGRIDVIVDEIIVKNEDAHIITAPLTDNRTKDTEQFLSTRHADLK